MVRTAQDIEFEKRVSRSILASRQTAIPGEVGKTGEWRSVRPILIAEDCFVVKLNQPSCHLCWMYCPEMTVSRTIPPEFDLVYCKGCGVCAHECPAHAIRMVPEKEAPSCTHEEEKVENLKP